MPYQPTNPYPYNVAINLNKEMQFSFKVDTYDVVEGFKIELYDYLKQKKLYTIIRTIGENNEQILEILDYDGTQLLLKEMDWEEEFEGNSFLPVNGGKDIVSIIKVNLFRYIAELQKYEQKKYYQDTKDILSLNITNEECFEINEDGIIINYNERKNINENGQFVPTLVIPYKLPYEGENKEVKEIEVRGIAEGVFKNSQIERVVFPTTLSTIGDNAFENCTNLHTIDFNSGNPIGGNSIVGNSAFQGCSKLYTINFVESISSIGSYAFADCIALTYVELSVLENFKDIQEGVFSNTNLSVVTLPNKIQTISDKAFAYCHNLFSIKFNNNLQTIGNEAFVDCNLLQKIEINEGVKSIGTWAFKGCENLEEVSFPNSVEKINIVNTTKNQKGILNGCINLRKITLPFVGIDVQDSHSNTNKIGALFDVSNESIPINLEQVVLTNCIFISTECFSSCVNLRSIELPKGLEIINKDAFYNCIRLESIDIPETVMEIGESAFALESKKELNNDEIFNVNFNGVKLQTIGSKAFQNRNEITTLSIPANTEGSIGNNAFNGCDSLLSIKLPIKNEFNFVNLFEKVPDSLCDVEINGVYNNCIPVEAFYNTTKLFLKKIKVPDSVIKIGEKAFYNAGLEKFIMPSCVNDIGENAFNMEQLSEIPILWWNTQLTEDTEFIPNELTYYFGTGIETCYGNRKVEEKNSLLVRLFGEEHVLSDSGDCGEDGSPINWKFDGETLWIVGNNNSMKDYSFTETGMIPPWHGFNKSIKNIIIQNVSYIGKYAFAKLKGDFSVEFNYNNSSKVIIGEKAFSESNLSKINLPSCVKTIKTQAFSNCNKLTEIVISNTVESIEKEILYGSYNITDITIPSLWTEKGEFNNIGYLWYYNTDKTTKTFEKAKSYSIEKDTITYYYFVPKEMNEIKITKGHVPKDFFAELVSWKSFVLSPSVTWDNGIFSCQESLQRLELPVYTDKNVSLAFVDTASRNNLYYIKINNANIPDTNIINFSFKTTNFEEETILDLSECVSLKALNNTYFFREDFVSNGIHLNHLILPDTVDTIEGSLFSYEKDLKTIKGGSICYIGKSVFNGLTSLTHIDTKPLKTIGEHAFENCEKLQVPIHFSSTLKTISEAVFHNCKALQQVVSDSTQLIIEDLAFCNCEKLKFFNGIKIQVVGHYAFCNCVELKTITGLTINTKYDVDISYSGMYRGYNFYGCESLELSSNFTFNDSCIPQYCFFNCKQLLNKNSGELKLGKNVQIIEEGAFGNCNISKLVVPNTVTKIGMGAFFNYQGEEITVPFIGSSFSYSSLKLGEYGTYIGKMFWSIFGIGLLEYLPNDNGYNKEYYCFSAPQTYEYSSKSYDSEDEAFYYKEIRPHDKSCDILLGSDGWRRLKNDGEYEYYVESLATICFPKNLTTVYIDNNAEVILSDLAFYDDGKSKLLHTYFKKVELVNINSFKQNIGAYSDFSRWDKPDPTLYSSHPYFTCKAQEPEQWEFAIGANYLSSSYSLLSNDSIELLSSNNETLINEQVLFLDYNKKYSWDLLTYGNKYDVYITDNNTYTDGYSYLPKIYVPNHSGVEVGQQIVLQGEQSYKIDKIDRFKTTGKIYYRQSKGILSGQLSYYGVTKGTLHYDEEGEFYHLSEESDGLLWNLLGNSIGTPIKFSTSSIYNESLCKGKICREANTTAPPYKVSIKDLSNEETNIFEDSTNSKFTTIALQYVILNKATLPLELMHTVKGCTKLNKGDTLEDGTVLEEDTILKDGTKFTVMLDSIGNGIQTVSEKTEDFEIVFSPGFKITTTGYAQTTMTLADEQLILPNNLDTKEVLIVIDTKGKITLNGNSGDEVNQGIIDANLSSIIIPNTTQFSIKDYNDSDNQPIMFTITSLDAKTNLITFDKSYRISNTDDIIQEIQLNEFLDIGVGDSKEFDIEDLSLTLNYINIYKVEQIEKYNEAVTKKDSEQLYLVTCKEVVNPKNFEVTERTLEKEAILERNSMILTVTTMDGNPPPTLLVEANTYYEIYSNYIKSPPYYFESMEEGIVNLWQDGNKLQPEQDNNKNDLPTYNLKDLTSSTSVFEATYDGNVSFYNWSLQELYEDEYIEIDRITNKYSTNIYYNYNFFEDDVDYRLILTIVTAEGLVVKRYIYFHVLYNTFLGIRNVIATKDCINQAIKLDFTHAKLFIGVEYACCSQSWLDDPNLHYEFLYLLITRQIKGQAETAITIAHLYDIVDSFYDYSFNREEEYVYSVIPIFKDVNQNGLEQDIIIKGTPYEVNPSIQFNLQTIALIGTQITFNDLLEETQSITNSYLVDDGEFNRWYFKYNTEAKNININTDKTIFETISPYATVGGSNRNYKTGTITALLGAFHKNNELDQWTYKDSIRLQNKFQSFANNGKVKMLRDEMGNVLPVDITLKSFEYTPHTIPTTIKVSFEWSQVGAEEDFAVYGLKPIEPSGFITLNEVEEEGAGFVKKGIVSKNLINYIIPNQTYFSLNQTNYTIKSIEEISGKVIFENGNGQGYYKQEHDEDKYYIQLFNYQQYGYTTKSNLKYNSKG